MLQQLIIALAVLFAAGYVIWTFTPAARRQRWLDALASRAVLTRAAARHRARLSASGCSHCSSADRHAHTHRRKPAPH
ncbi:MAG TPA: hypothetical protein VHX52_09855 [Steroidobacteraceae bacterium]|jgi:hypothetical protein|nr:hypothetical protein [Steroidobacteraceae bacterium]